MENYAGLLDWFLIWDIKKDKYRSGPLPNSGLESSNDYYPLRDLLVSGE